MKNILGINLLTFCALLYLNQVQQICKREKYSLEDTRILKSFFEAPPTCIHKSETKGQFLIKKTCLYFLDELCLAAVWHAAGIPVSFKNKYTFFC